jgi:hypothetical protein
VATGLVTEQSSIAIDGRWWVRLIVAVVKWLLGELEGKV